MGDEKHPYIPVPNAPIPTYDEATSSQTYLGPSEISNDAERQGLLGRAGPPPTSTYRPPTVESARSSIDFLPSSNASSARNSVEGLRGEMAQMEVLDPPTEQSTLSKHLSSFTSAVSSINFPFRRYIPSLSKIKAYLPSLPEGFTSGHNGLSLLLAVRLIALLMIGSIAYVIFFTNIFNFRRTSSGHMYEPESVRVYVQGSINATKIGENAEYLTRFDHIAGTEGGYVLAKWVESEFIKAGLEDVALERFDVYMNYPKAGGRRVAIIDPPELRWEAKIEEESAVPGREQTMAFHGYSRSGDVTGPIIYANYGSKEDFKKLEDEGISLKGAIALVRYYGTQGDRGMKVKAAELAGAVGCIIYSDPQDDGQDKGKVYPDGPYRPADGLQRGTVALTNWIAGDPLTPGFASTPGEKHRMSKDNNTALVNIPSIPLAWRDAQKLLQALKGHGKRIEEAAWKVGVPDIEWWTGDSKSPIVNLKNEQDEEIFQPIYNVLARIEGTEQPDKKIVIGNHRDAWCFGAVDPGSGTAVMVEVARVFGELRSRGWRPLRTIEFASWDAEEYNLVGSTEHVEHRLKELQDNGVAYINVDGAVSGPDFAAEGSPLMEKALLRVLDRVGDARVDKSLRDIWMHTKGKSLGDLGAGSDYVGFQDFAGMSSISMEFRGPPGAFPYHSCYETYDLMSKHIDPGFKYHAAMGEVWGLLILELADEMVVPLDLQLYASAVRRYLGVLNKNVKARNSNGKTLDLKPLDLAITLFEKLAADFHKFDDRWVTRVYANGGFEDTITTLQRLSHNDRLVRFESNLIDPEQDGGLRGRKQYKHILAAPSLDDSYGGGYFPFITDALDEGDWDYAQKMVEKTARLLENACQTLNE